MGHKFEVSSSYIDVGTPRCLEYRLCYNLDLICRVRLYKTVNHKWFLHFAGDEQWIVITEPRKAIYIKARVLDHVLTNFNQIIDEAF